MLRLWRATINTRNGLAFAIRSEQAVREELLALTLSVPLALLSAPVELAWKYLMPPPVMEVLMAEKAAPALV